jgi:hypothetical protein
VVESTKRYFHHSLLNSSLWLHCVCAAFARVSSFLRFKVFHALTHAFTSVLHIYINKSHCCCYLSSSSALLIPLLLFSNVVQIMRKCCGIIALSFRYHCAIVAQLLRNRSTIASLFLLSRIAPHLPYHFASAAQSRQK